MAEITRLQLTTNFRPAADDDQQQVFGANTLFISMSNFAPEVSVCGQLAVGSSKLMMKIPSYAMFMPDLISLLIIKA